MDQHLPLMGAVARVIFNGDTIKPGAAGEGVRLCPIPVKELTDNSKNKLVQNTIALRVTMSLLGLDFQILANALTLQFQCKGQAMVDENIGVANMAIGAAHSHSGCRAMCATSGGDFALMTEAIGMAGMMELLPVVFIKVQRAGPSTGVPTKTEQGDLWQVLGASQGDFERFIVSPATALDAFKSIPELFNLVAKCQCPDIVISDLLTSEGTFSVDPDDINMRPTIDRGELITEPSKTDGYLRYKDTDSGISPRALPGLDGYVHVVASDEHRILISDEFINLHKRRKMVEKRARKFQTVAQEVLPLELEGLQDTAVTLVGWGSTYGVMKDAVEQLKVEGTTANHLLIKWIVPFHAEAVTDILSRAKRTIIVENSYSGQFYRYLRSETGLSVGGHIRTGTSASMMGSRSCLTMSSTVCWSSSPARRTVRSPFRKSWFRQNELWSKQDKQKIPWPTEPLFKTLAKTNRSFSSSRRTSRVQWTRTGAWAVATSEY